MQSSLQWWPVAYHVHYKLCLMMFAASTALTQLLRALSDDACCVYSTYTYVTNSVWWCMLCLQHIHILRTLSDDVCCLYSTYTTVTSSVWWCMLFTSHTQVPESQCFRAAVDFDLPTQAISRYLAPGLNSEKAYSVASPREWNAMPAINMRTPKYMCLNELSKHTILTFWLIISINYM